jgi:hypothetical protein
MEVRTLRQENFDVSKMLVWCLLNHTQLSSDFMTATNNTATLK